MTIELLDSGILSNYKTQLSDSSAKIFSIKLNRSKSLNALNLAMLTELYRLWRPIEEGKNEEGIAWITLTSDDPRGFCAGGDVKDLALQLKNLPSESAFQACENFFALEYSVDELGYLISKKIPTYFFGHGIIYGGGLGLIQGFRHRYVDMSARFSMPETKIGLFPDVGSSHFMAKSIRWKELFLFSLASWEFGPRLAIEANLIDGVFKGIYKASEKDTKNLDNTIAECEKLAGNNSDQFTRLLEKSFYQSHEEISWTDKELFINKLSKEKFVQDWFKEIEKIYQEDWNHLVLNQFLIDSICQKLLQLFELAKIHQFTDWSDDCLKRCPSSLAVTVLLFLKGKELTLHENFLWEQGLAQFMCLRPDFFEGVRALLIDKDMNPRWHKGLKSWP